ncbi:MAG TPA: BTAD domain-containing putative transcriptional regulator [Candidatus Limnocylindrales bacterium]
MRLLRLRLVGEFAVYQDGRLLASGEVGSRKARTLLALLAAQRGRLVPVDRIVDALWRNAPQRPVENVATMVSRLRAAVGRDVISGGRIGYRLAPAVQVDLDCAAAMVGAAEAHMADRKPYLAFGAAQQALDLLLADDMVLADYPAAAWAEPPRARHAGLLRRARHVAAVEALQTGFARAAEAIARSAVAADPFDETAYRALMAAYDAVGEPAQALIAYERLRVMLARELGIEPDHATRRLYVSILRHNLSTSGAITRESRV